MKKPKNHGKPWTEEDKEIVRRKFRHMSCEEIGQILGRTRNSVYERRMEQFVTMDRER